MSNVGANSPVVWIQTRCRERIRALVQAWGAWTAPGAPGRETSQWSGASRR